MYKKEVFWYIVITEIIVEIILLGLIFGISRYKDTKSVISTGNNNNIESEENSKTSNDKLNNKSDIDKDKDFIKWVDFKVSTQALKDAYFYDVESYYGRIETEIDNNKIKNNKLKLNWIELLAYLACCYGGDFKKYKKIDMQQLVTKIQNGETLEKLTANMKYYNYYNEAYEAVLGGMVGKYTLGGEEKYGLKAYFPIAKNYPYSHYDDFGVSREYGYKRKHLGHDMLGQVGTPIIASESGYIEAIGWNQYGGWRLGIRSFDQKRYYYYAHLRKNFPYKKQLKEGSIVTAGDVIGYMGRTGYSSKENVNNIDTSHLHFGIQLIFDESQKEGNNEIWIDCYNIINFLYMNRSETIKNLETKEYSRVVEMIDPSVEKFQKKCTIYKGNINK